MAVIHVTVFGQRLVWLKHDDSDEGPLALPDHIDEDGNVKLEHAFDSDSFAHVCDDGKIRRYGEVIGSVGDLVIISPQ